MRKQMIGATSRGDRHDSTISRSVSLGVERKRVQEGGAAMKPLLFLALTCVSFSFSALCETNSQEAMECLKQDAKMPIKPKVLVEPDEGSGIAGGNSQLSIPLPIPFQNVSLVQNSVEVGANVELREEDRAFQGIHHGFGPSWRLVGDWSGLVRLRFDNEEELKTQCREQHASSVLDANLTWHDYIPEKVEWELGDGGVIRYSLGEKLPNEASLYDASKTVKVYRYRPTDQRMSTTLLYLELGDNQIRAYGKSPGGLITTFSVNPSATSCDVTEFALKVESLKRVPMFGAMTKGRTLASPKGTEFVSYLDAWDSLNKEFLSKEKRKQLGIKDKKERIESISWGAQGQYKLVFSYTRNNGELESVTFPDNSRLDVSYHQESPTSSTSFVKQVSYRGESSEYCYFKNGAIRWERSPDNTVTEYVYDETSASEISRGGGQVLSSLRETFKKFEGSTWLASSASSGPNGSGSVSRTYDQKKDEDDILVTETVTPGALKVETGIDPKTKSFRSRYVYLNDKFASSLVIEGRELNFQQPTKVIMSSQGISATQESTYMADGQEKLRTVTYTLPGRRSIKEVTDYGFDAEQRINRVTKSRKGPKQSESMYEFGQGGCGSLHPIKETDMYGNTTEYTYNYLGSPCEVSSVTDPLGRKLFAAFPDEFGRVKTIKQHAGSTREFSYDSMGRPQGAHAITSFGGDRVPYTVNQKWGPKGQHAGVDINGPLSVSASGLGSRFDSLTVDGKEVMNAYGPTCLEPGKC